MCEKCVRECGYVCSCSCSCGGRCNVWHIDVHAVMRFVCEVPHVLDQSIEPQCLWDFWRERIHVHHAGHGQRVKREVAMLMLKERARWCAGVQGKVEGVDCVAGVRVRERDRY